MCMFTYIYWLHLDTMFLGWSAQPCSFLHLPMIIKSLAPHDPWPWPRAERSAALVASHPGYMNRWLPSKIGLLNLLKSSEIYKFPWFLGISSQIMCSPEELQLIFGTSGCWESQPAQHPPAHPSPEPAHEAGQSTPHRQLTVDDAKRKPNCTVPVTIWLFYLWWILM